MNTLEQDLRRELTQGGETAVARATAAREEALRALASGIRRARVRRVASIAGAGLSIAGIGVVLVLALPRGAEDGPPSGTTVAATPFPALSVLDRPATADDRLAALGAGSVDATTARLVASTGRFRFFAARDQRRADMTCLIVAGRGTNRGSARAIEYGCVDPGLLAETGILAVGRSFGTAIHIGAIVPDGITAVRLGGRQVPIRGNALAVVWRGTTPPTVTLIGPAAPLVMEASGTHDRLADGTSAVTVPFSALASSAPREAVPAPAPPPVAPNTALRGHRIMSVIATPIERRLTRTGTSVPASNELAWRVTLLNGGDFVESAVRVVALFRYPGEKPVVHRTTVRTEPGKPFTVRFRGPAVDALLLGVRGTLDVRVAPVQGERNTGNNRVVYPVTITFG